MAEDVEIPANNELTDSSHSRQKDERLTNAKNDVPRYEENRRSERHILFHFFTLFSISFISGIILIHLSLWMNSYMHATFSAPQFDEEHLPSQESYDVDYPQDLHATDETESRYTSVYTQDPKIKKLFQYHFYYTGVYFNTAGYNATTYAQQDFSSNIAVK